MNITIMKIMINNSNNDNNHNNNDENENENLNSYKSVKAINQNKKCSSKSSSCLLKWRETFRKPCFVRTKESQNVKINKSKNKNKSR